MTARRDQSPPAPKAVVEPTRDAGFRRLAQAGKATVWRILDAHELKPHRVRYHLERRDAQFERKMAEVLMVYRDVNLYRADAAHDARRAPIYTVSVDQKPGVQALGTTAPDLPPSPGKHAGIGRDYEYVRHGTLSILAALDLHTGVIIANVELRHRSVEFVALLRRLDEHYPAEAVIRVVLDNHSAQCTHPSTAPGSTWWSLRSPGWRARSCDTSESHRSMNSSNGFSKALTK